MPEQILLRTDEKWRSLCYVTISYNIGIVPIIIYYSRRRVGFKKIHLLSFCRKTEFNDASLLLWIPNNTPLLNNIHYPTLYNIVKSVMYVPTYRERYYIYIAHYNSYFRQVPSFSIIVLCLIPICTQRIQLTYIGTYHHTYYQIYCASTSSVIFSSIYYFIIRFLTWRTSDKVFLF